MTLLAQGYSNGRAPMRVRYSIHVSMFPKCFARGLSAAFFITALVFFWFPLSSFAAAPSSSSSFLGQLQGLLTSLVGRAAPGSSGSPSAQSAAPSSPVNAVTGVPFGGPIIFGPIKGTTPPGATYVIVGPPVSKPLLCQKGVCKTYDAQPPYKLGQYLLGVALPTPIPCIVGITPIPQPPGFPIGNTPGVGASTAGGASSEGQ